MDPGWANDALAVMAAGLCTRIRTVYCQEIFDYFTYNQPHAVRVSCGFGGSMDDIPMMLLPSIPTMVWGGNIRLIGRGLGLEIDEITEVVERLPLEESVDNVMGRFEKGSQGAFWLKIIGWSGGSKRIVVDHITRIDPACAPQWPQPDEGSATTGSSSTGRSAVDHRQPGRRSRWHPRGRWQHHGRQSPPRCDRMAGHPEARHLRRPRRTAAHPAARGRRGHPLVK